MEALLFIITNPSRIWRAVKLKDEVCCLKRTVEILKDTHDFANLPGLARAVPEIERQITIIDLQIELLLDPSVVLP